jgi:DNA modification methylase
MHYLDTILLKSNSYLKDVLSTDLYDTLIMRIAYIYDMFDTTSIVKEFCKVYVNLIKEIHQSTQPYNKSVSDFIESGGNKKLIWGDCYDVLRDMKSESVHCIVTSPPYYNVRDYSQWDNIDSYLSDMENILRECYRVLDNHRVMVLNVGDIFDNDNKDTRSGWGKRRIPLGAYFTTLFEKVGFTFIDDIIWDKGEVQSERHKNGDRPYPFYQYPMNCYEHILIFHKHRIDEYRYPCPICGSLNVNVNSYSEKGLLTWECKNSDCFNRSGGGRGKRFSAKTYFTQDDDRNKDSEIDDEYIYSWRRDIRRFNPVIKITSKGVNRLGHTAPYPKDIPEFATRMFTYKGEVVLDPFSGLGTSLRTACYLGRVGLGIERDESIKENVYEFVGRSELFSDNDLKELVYKN